MRVGDFVSRSIDVLTHVVRNVVVVLDVGMRFRTHAIDALERISPTATPKVMKLLRV